MRVADRHNLVIMVHGDYMVEIFRVLYLGRDEIKPSGTIRVNNRRNCQYLYNVPVTDQSIPSIKPGDELPLTGPSVGAICCPCGVRIEVDLFDGAYKAKICMDEWEQSYSLDSFNCIESRLLSEDGEGEIVIVFGLYCNAVEACFDITLFHMDESVAEVYGIISAASNQIKNPQISTCLFLGQSSSQKIVVKSPKLTRVPLSRAFVAVPLDSQLYVDVCLSSDKCMNNKIFCDTLVFEAKTCGIYQKTMHGLKAKIGVRVKWDVNCRYRGESCISECRWPNANSDIEYSDSGDENPLVEIEDPICYGFRALFLDI